MFVNQNYFILFNDIYKNPQNTIKFNSRHGELGQGCVLSESYTATDVHPADAPSLSPTVVAGLRVRYSRHHSSPEMFFVWKICS
jgi:hypothetical protein